MGWPLQYLPISMHFELHCKCFHIWDHIRVIYVDLSLIHILPDQYPVIILLCYGSWEQCKIFLNIWEICLDRPNFGHESTLGRQSHCHLHSLERLMPRVRRCQVDRTYQNDAHLYTSTIKESVRTFIEHPPPYKTFCLYRAWSLHYESNPLSCEGATFMCQEFSTLKLMYRSDCILEVQPQQRLSS